MAYKQWVEYVRVIAEYTKCAVHEVAEADDLPDGVFVEDAVVHLGLPGGPVVLTNPGSDSRKPEVASVRAALGPSCSSLESIKPPGTLDGGDVLVVPPTKTVYIGLSARTDSHGIAQFAALAETVGYTTRTVPVSKVLHLKSALTALPDGRLVCWQRGLCLEGLAALKGAKALIFMPEEQGAHVVVLGPSTLLLSAAAPLSAELLRGLGYTVLTVDISEFEKLDGCVTCLSVRVRERSGL